MNRILPLLIVVAMFLLVLPQPILADSQTGVLRPFATLPTGLSAEGLAIRGSHFYVGSISFSGTDGSILVFDQSGELTQAFTVPGMPVVGQVAVRNDTLYAVACTSFAPGATGAVVKVDLHSGAVTTFATDPACPNGLTIDRHGNIFVTDILAGTVSKVTPTGALSVFASGPLLATAPISPTTAAGPNDITLDTHQDALYVSNVGQGTIVKIGLEDNGSAGPISVFASGVPTPDGLAFATNGNLYVASPFTNSIYVVAPDGSASPLALNTTSESLNNPSNVAFLGHSLYISNLGLSTSTGYLSVVSLHIPGNETD